MVKEEHTTVPWRSGYRGGLLSRFPLGAQVRILPASKFFFAYIFAWATLRRPVKPSTFAINPNKKV